MFYSLKSEKSLKKEINEYMKVGESDFMKRKIIIYTLVLILIVSIIVFLSLKGRNQNREETKKTDTFIENIPIGNASNLINEDEMLNVENVLKHSKIDNIDVLISWIKEFNKEPYQNTGMVNKWTKYNVIKYNEAELANRWEKNHEQSDSDCRMTAFLLLKDHLKMNQTIKDYGSYLMFDMDAIDNNKDYEVLKANRNDFITLFNEIDVKDLSKEEIKAAYNKKWKEYGISMKESNASLITVIMHDNYDNVAFLGHAGVLIDLKGKLLFVEKIAFEQPYQVTVLESREELKNMLFSRKTYFGDKTEEGPFIYENDKLLYSYK